MVCSYVMSMFAQAFQLPVNSWEINWYSSSLLHIHFLQNVQMLPVAVHVSVLVQV